MNSTITDILTRSGSLKSTIAKDSSLVQAISAGAKQLIQTVQNGGTIYTCGNGGSACDAMHFVEELVTRYKRERPGIRAMHFFDPGSVTCWSNDYSFEGVFERYVRTFCGEKDTLVGFTTSGKSPNLLNAVKAAKEKKTFSIGLLGKGGGPMAPLCDLKIIVPSEETERIQEVHITIVHIWCELLEMELFR